MNDGRFVDTTHLIDKNKGWIRSNLSFIRDYTLDESKLCIERILQHDQPSIGASPGHDVDAIIILRGAYKNEMDQRLRRKFEGAIHSLMVDLDEKLRLCSQKVNEDSLARLLILLEELELIEERSIVATWVEEFEFLCQMESSEGNLHYLVTSAAKRLEALSQQRGA
jgi:hypothetical protein